MIKECHKTIDLHWSVYPKLIKGKGVIVHKIVFWEAENCYAEETLDPTQPEVGERYG